MAVHHQQRTPGRRQRIIQLVLSLPHALNDAAFRRNHVLNYQIRHGAGRLTPLGLGRQVLVVVVRLLLNHEKDLALRFDSAALREIRPDTALAWFYPYRTSGRHGRNRYSSSIFAPFLAPSARASRRRSLPEQPASGGTRVAGLPQRFCRLPAVQ